MALASADRLTMDERRELAAFAEPLRSSLTRFVRHEMSADDFEGEFLRVFSHIPGIPTDPVGNALNEIFFAVEDYVGHGMEVVPQEGDIDASELHRRARSFIELVGWAV